MKPIDVGRISITPFEFESILEIRIEKPLNDHATLYVHGIVKDDLEDMPVHDMTESTQVKCENDGQIYFSGVLQSVTTTCIDAVYYLEVFAVSSTILLDTVKHKRSFQDNTESYKSIVEKIIKDNQGTVTFNADELNVENILVQYDETDWEFAKRLASHTQSVLIPIAVSDNPDFHFGVADEGSGEIAARNYSVRKNLKAFRRMSQEELPFSAQDAISYTVKTDDYIYEPGEKVTLNGKALYVSRADLTLEQSAVSCLYTLTTKNAISAPKFYNRAVIGLVLDGVVLKAENDNVKLHLSIDDEQDEGKAHLFAYSTGYSAEGHTGWSVMPEEGDTVQLLFPKEDEKFAFAATSVRQEDTDKTSDPLVKFLRTTFGKEIKFNNKEILITGKDDDTFIKINEDTGIEIITSKPIKVTSGDTIDITSANDMKITSGKNLTITATDSIKMNCGGNNVTIEPPTGIKVSTDKEIKMNSNGNTSVDSKKGISVNSGDDIKISAGKKLLESARSEISLACSGSSIKMDGQINIRGSLIKKN
jgi:hypothetical protein